MRYVFGQYEINLERYELCCENRPIKIEPKAFDALVYLVQHRGRVVSKEELYEQLWSDQYVSESALTYCISEARKAVGDSGRAQRLIKTIHGRGYSFIAPVEEADSVEEAAGLDGSPPDASELPATSDAPGTEAPEPVLDTTPPAEPAPITERRQLTIMWCQIAITSNRGGPVDPEDQHELLLLAQTQFGGLIDQYQGHVSQSASYGLLAYFGYPHASEDDARRAVGAGLAIVQTLTALQPQPSATLTVKIGIHTGLVVVSPETQDDTQTPFTLADTSHIAAQLVNFAEANTVVVSPSTLQLVDGYMVHQSLGTFWIEELSQELAAYHILRESGAQSRLEAARMTQLTPFVGREQEAAWLYERWEQTKAGMGQVVLLSGEGGIGKSRLVNGLREHATAHPHTWMAFQCSRHMQHSAFYPLIDYFQRVTGLNRDDSPEHNLKKLEIMLEPLGFNRDESVPLLASLCDIPLPASSPPLNLPPQRQKQQILDIFLTWCLSATEAEPVCIVIEDLHWSDPSTQDFLSLLTDYVPRSHLLVLLTFRPDFRPPWAMRSYISFFALNPLTPAQAEQMMTEIAGGRSLPTAIVDQIVARTDGVPLFIEEMTRMVIESGFVKEVDDHFELADSLAPLEIPTTLHDSLMARLDRLGSAKHTAQLAATLGREFTYEIISAVAAIETDALQRDLSQLVDAELLYQRGTAAQTTYFFKHALIQDAAYQSLLRRSRSRYHRQIALILEERFRETCESQPEWLAYHYTEAGLAVEAMTYWQRAIQRAMPRSAHQEAMAHAEQGLTIARSLPESPERYQFELLFQTALGTALTHSQGYDAPDVVQAFMRARQLCQQVGDMPQLFGVLRGLWVFYLFRGEEQTGYELGQHLMELATRQEEPTLLLEAHRALGTTLFFLGDYSQSSFHLDQALTHYDPDQRQAIAMRFGSDSGVVAQAYAALNLWLIGYPDLAVAQIREAVTIAESPVYPLSKAMVHIVAAYIYQVMSDRQQMQTHADVCMELARDHELPFMSSQSIVFQGWGLAVEGDLAAGIQQIRQGLSDYLAAGAKLARPYLLSLLADVYLRAGQIDVGLDTIAEALACPESAAKSEIYRLQAELLLQQEPLDVQQVETAFRHSLDLAREQHATMLELRSALSWYRFSRQQGSAVYVKQLLQELYDRFTEGYGTAELQEAQMILGTEEP